jgi:NitT/TauT family transport system substrate-binding protein
MRRLFALCASLVLAAACAGGSSPSAPTSQPATQPPSTASAEPSESSIPSGPPTSINFRFDFIKTPGDIAFLSAEAQGYFEEENLEVTRTVGSGSTDSVTLTGAGQFQMAQAAATAVVVGVASGVPVKSVGVLYATDANGMVSRPDAPVREPTDLYGKKYGVRQGTNLLLYQAVVAKFDLDRSQITEVPIGFGIEPIIVKQIDAFIQFGDGELVDVRNTLEEEPVWVPLGDWDIHTYGTTLIVNTDWAAENEDAVRGFVRAYAKGLKWALENPDDAITLIQEVYSDVDAKSLNDRLTAALPYFYNEDSEEHGLLWMNEDRWRTDVIDLARQVELITTDVPVEDAMTNEYLPDPAVFAAPAN